MGIFENFCYVVSGIVTETECFIRDVKEDTRQLGDELIHCYDSSYVSPYEKKEQAARIIEKADDKLYKAQESYRRQYKRTGEALKRNYERKTRLQAKLKQQLQHTVSSRNPVFGQAPDISFARRDEFVFGEMLGIFGHQLRDAAATSYLEDAKDYRLSVEHKVADIRYKEGILYSIEMQMQKEERLFDTMENEIARRTQAQQHRMAEVLKGLLNESVCDRSGEISRNYMNLFNQLSNLA